ncbi:hypothetical protein [Sphingomonas sp. VNH70]|uniref:hypothetical protein n=1 Tax=Sphingomonas silueang TaxID=3156617 RepID=UPI0032B4B9CB
MSPLPIALVSIALSVAAQFALKAGMAGRARGLALLWEPWLLAGFALYGIGALVWLAVLARWDVSKAYPLVGLGFAASVAIGWAAGEQVSALRVAGVALVCAGVACIARS